MTEYPRGSEWRRWDLHVHTPASYLSNEFGDPNVEAAWDSYVAALFSKAIEKGICAIGITDYFSIEGYEKVSSYQKNSEKLRSLGFDENKIKEIKNILLLPNIELRLKCIVGSNRVNFHVIFSNNVNTRNIKENFLENLNFSYTAAPDNPDYKYKLKKINLETLGEKLIKEQPSFQGKSPIYVGAMNAVVDDNEISKILSETHCFKNSYLTAIPVDEDLSTLSWNSQDHQTRKLLYQKTHCFFSSNNKTRNFGLGLCHNTEADYIKEFKTFKPCIHGSDAHKIEKLFLPDNDNFCWIKADPTFEGLKQILFEPSERVLISPTKPETKADYFVIDRVIFNDDNFQKKPIFFNDKLNCIIGGKSTGKSILLQNMAMAIDKAEAEKNLDRSKTKTLDVGNLSVIWRDDKEENRKIIYIPQTYLNKLSDEKEETTEIDRWILDILLKNEPFKSTYEIFKNNINELKKHTSKVIVDFVSVCSDITKLKNDQSEIGDKIGIEAEIKKLNDEKSGIALTSEIKEDNLKSYETASKKINETDSLLQKVNADSNIIEPIETVLEIKGFPFGLTDESLSKVQEIQNSILKEANEKWSEKKKIILETFSSKRQDLDSEKETSQLIIDKLKPLIEQNKVIIELTNKIHIEQIKLAKVTEFQAKIDAKNLEKKETLEDLISIPKRYEDFHQIVIDAVNNMGKSDKNLEFYSELQFRKEAFVEKILSIYHNSNPEVKRLTNDEDFTKEKYLNSAIKDILEKTYTKELPLKSSYTVETAYREILDDWFNTSFKVKMGEDTISMMSPGKKALVLLKVLISLADSKCPILIDQPEDDLDNRSIYKDLSEFIKEKKKERQIIVVTHNANIVVGADAEEVIVANQKGDDCPNKDFRFEYRTGSIENISPILNENNEIEKGILNKKGIQEHICDILEGGEKAFELRKKKYHI